MGQQQVARLTRLPKQHLLLPPLETGCRTRGVIGLTQEDVFSILS